MCRNGTVVTNCYSVGDFIITHQIVSLILPISAVLFTKFLAFSMKIYGYFGIFLYILILKKKLIWKRLKQAANLVEKIEDL